MIQSRRDFKLATGRILSLEAIDQWSVYAGLLEGHPIRARNDAQVAKIRAHVLQRDGREPFLIEPVQRPIEHPPDMLGERAALPAIACVGRFLSHAPARDPRMDCSGLTVIWFQDDYAFPLVAAAEAALRALDWHRLAVDGNY